MTSKPETGGALAVMCSLNEIDRAVRAEAVERFIVDAVAVTATQKGVLLKFARNGANARAVLDFIRIERECCARYEYHLRSGKDTLDLEITGQGSDVHHLQTFYLGLAPRPE